MDVMFIDSILFSSRRASLRSSWISIAPCVFAFACFYPFRTNSCANKYYECRIWRWAIVSKHQYVRAIPFIAFSASNPIAFVAEYCFPVRVFRAYFVLFAFSTSDEYAILYLHQQAWKASTKASRDGRDELAESDKWSRLRYRHGIRVYHYSSHPSRRSVRAPKDLQCCGWIAIALFLFFSSKYEFCVRSSIWSAEYYKRRTKRRTIIAVHPYDLWLMLL